MTDEKLSDGVPTGWKPLEHFMQCPVCQKFFDMRKLDLAMEHARGGEPLGELPSELDDASQVSRIK